MCLQEIQQQNATPFFCFFFSGSSFQIAKTMNNFPRQARDKKPPAFEHIKERNVA